MIQFKIELDKDADLSLYNDYSKFIFESVIKTLRESADLRKYHIREVPVIESSLIDWVQKPQRINLFRLVEESLILKKESGTYIICLNDYKYVPYSKTKLSTLVRLLEYGNEKIPPYPLLRSVLSYYSHNYESMIIKFMEARLSEDESVPLRKISRRAFEVCPGR